MKMNYLGRTGLRVSEVALGTVTFGGGGYFDLFGGIGQKDADAIVNVALDAGVNLFDTADGYSAVEKIRQSKFVRCYYCGKWLSGARAHVEHIKPLMRGGQHSAFNIVPACPKCNWRKNAKSVNDFIKQGQLLLIY